MKEEIKKLIEVAMTDGVITAKEREVILKKAVALGEDTDEVELYLEAELQKVERKSDAAIRQAKGKTCPYCGGPIPLLTDKCPHCGQFVTALASEELQEILEVLEDALVDLKSGKNVERSKALVEKYSRKANLYYHNNPKIQLLLREIEKEKAKAIINAKRIERKKAFVSLLSNNKKTTAVVVIFIIGLVIWGVKSLMPTPMNEDPEATVAAAIEAVEKGELEKAESYCAAYQYSYRIAAAYRSIAIAYANKGDFTKAIANVSEVSRGWDADADRHDPTRTQIQKMCINVGDYDMAESCFRSYDKKYYYDFLCRCIDNMKENSQNQKIKSFIDRKISFFPIDPQYDSDKNWKQAIVKTRLYEYAGLSSK